MAVPKTKFEDMKCIHLVGHTGPYGKPMRTLVFMDVDGNTYIWVTTAGQEFGEGGVYDFTANCNDRNVLSYVKLIKDYGIPDSDGKKSEQPNHPKARPVVDVFDLIFDTSDTHDTHLTND